MFSFHSWENTFRINVFIRYFYIDYYFLFFWFDDALGIVVYIYLYFCKFVSLLFSHGILFSRVPRGWNGNVLASLLSISFDLWKWRDSPCIRYRRSSTRTKQADSIFGFAASISEAMFAGWLRHDSTAVFCIQGSRLIFCFGAEHCSLFLLPRLFIEGYLSVDILLSFFFYEFRNSSTSG